MEKNPSPNTKVYVVRITNLANNEWYMLKNSLDETIAFEDRHDAIRWAKLHVRKRYHIERYWVYELPLWMVKAWFMPVQLCYGESISREEEL